MSESWNVETVADSKPEAPPEKTPAPAAAPIPSVLSNDYSLGKIMTMARENRGFSREQAAKASNIPGYYLTMIESDDYSSIADQLYLLPFLRRYATFVGLEPEEVASRFIRDVQRADMNPGRISEPMVMIADRKTLPWNLIFMIAGGVMVVIAIVWFGYRHFAPRTSTPATSNPPISAQPQEQAAPAQPEPASIPAAAAPPVSSGKAEEKSAPSPAAQPSSAPSVAARASSAASPAARASSAAGPAARAPSTISKSSTRPRVPKSH